MKSTRIIWIIASEKIAPEVFYDVPLMLSVKSISVANEFHIPSRDYSVKIHVGGTCGRGVIDVVLEMFIYFNC